jgi:hypothetical protein
VGHNLDALLLFCRRFRVGQPLKEEYPLLLAKTYDKDPFREVIGVTYTSDYADEVAQLLVALGS